MNFMMTMLLLLLLFRERRRELGSVRNGRDAPDGELGVELRLAGLDGLGVDFGFFGRRRQRRSRGRFRCR